MWCVNGLDHVICCNLDIANTLRQTSNQEIY